MAKQSVEWIQFGKHSAMGKCEEETEVASCESLFDFGSNLHTQETTYGSYQGWNE